MSVLFTQRKNKKIEYRLFAHGETDVGLCREINEDFLIVDQDHGLLAVFDGIGGAVAGEVASELAAIHLRDNLEKLGVIGDQALDPESAMRKLAIALDETNRAIFETSSDNLQLQGMGTTATVLLLCSDCAVIANVGDSRLYRVRDHGLELITNDHTMARELLQEGFNIHNDEALRNFRRVLTKSLGRCPTVEPDLFSVRLRPKDRFILCTDGLSDYFAPTAGGGPMPNISVSTFARCLVKLAKKCGGADNITVIVADVMPCDP